MENDFYSLGVGSTPTLYQLKAQRMDFMETLEDMERNFGGGAFRLQLRTGRQHVWVWRWSVLRHLRPCRGGVDCPAHCKRHLKLGTKDFVLKIIIIIIISVQKKKASGKHPPKYILTPKFYTYGKEQKHEGWQARVHGCYHLRR